MTQFVWRLFPTTAQSVIGLLMWMVLVGGAQTYAWRTYAGSTGGAGFSDGPVAVANFKALKAVATDAQGMIYLVDSGNHTIRRLDPAGRVTTLAGKGGVAGTTDGQGTAARFNSPAGIALGSDGSLYVADTANHTIRKVTPAGMVSTVAGTAGVAGSADGQGAAARWSSPTGMTAGPDGLLYIADTGNHLIRKLSLGGAVVTLTGQAGAGTGGFANGNLIAARFNSPKALTIDTAGNIYLSDTSNRVIRKISTAGEVTTLAGQVGFPGILDGIGTAAKFSNPIGITLDPAGNVYVGDVRAIRKISAIDAMVSTFAGLATTSGRTDGIGGNARFFRPEGMVMAPDGTLLLADSSNMNLRKITLDAAVTTLAGSRLVEIGAVDGAAAGARFNNPQGITLAADGTLYLADTGNRTVRRIGRDGVVSTPAGAAGQSGTTNAIGGDARFTKPVALAEGPDGSIFVADSVASWDGRVRRIAPDGMVSSVSPPATALVDVNAIRDISGLVVDAQGNVFASMGHAVRKITPDGIVSFVAGQKPLTTPGTGVVLQRMGTIDGTGFNALMNGLGGLAIRPDGMMFTAETYGRTIRKVTPWGSVTTLAGAPHPSSFGTQGAADGLGSAASFNDPMGIAVDAGGVVYVADTGNHTIRRMTPAGLVSTIGGLPGYAGSGEGSGDRMAFNQPADIAVDAAGNLYVADSLNHRIVIGVPQHPQLVIELPDHSQWVAGSLDLDFGPARPMPAGTSLELTLRNTGPVPLHLQALEVEGTHAADFRLEAVAAGDELAPGANRVLRIIYNPLGSGSRAARLRLMTDDPAAGVVELGMIGMGNLAPVFGGYAFSTPAGRAVLLATAKVAARAGDPEGDTTRVTAVEWTGGEPKRVLFSPTSIHYRPPAAVATSLTESFKVTLTDARGASVTGVVEVTVLPAAAASVTANPARITFRADGGVDVGFHGIPGRTYRIQRSTDLAAWQDLTTVTADAAGDVRHTDSAPLLPNGYYRLALP